MSGIQLEKGRAVYTPGQPMTALHLITKGRIQVSYPGGNYQIGKGDVVGACEVGSEIHFLEYITTEATEFITYPLPSMESLNDLLRKHPDVARLFVISAFCQLNNVLRQCELSELGCSNLCSDLQNDYSLYLTTCERYRIVSSPIRELGELPAFLGEEAPDLWLSGFYLGLMHLFTTGSSREFLQDPSVSLGFLRKAGLDFRKTYASLEERYRYQRKLNRFYFQEDGNDLFDRLTSLYYKMDQNSPDADELYTSISRIILQAEDNTALDAALVRKRTELFQNHVELLNDSAIEKETRGDGTPYIQELTGSLNTILEFAGPDLESAVSFRRHIHSYKALADKGSMEESDCQLRRELTEEFYALYAAIFERSLSEQELPAPVRMFLYFGYADEELAGAKNSIFLYSLASSLAGTCENGVYTFYDWLLAIFHGKKEPSRNEFGLDYRDFVHKQRLGGTITEAELRALEENSMGKVTFELRNLFPLANKMTFGRVTTFCPVFTQENALKELSSCLVTAATVERTLTKIRNVDYTAFYRETLDTEHTDIMGKEVIHVEYLPDIILMPNAGLRGIMWQEIEGKRRNSACRMALSIFHMEDLDTSLIRLTGEYRWEMCKRIQGSRWNDVSDRSLTSEYFDYVQFYRKNHDLSTEAKERIRLSLQRAKNSFKEMFVQDYMIWILFEGNGSPRLNKTARRILFTYCPFSAPVCERLRQNPLYGELLARRDMLRAQALHHLDVLRQKLLNGNNPIPESVEAERRYVEG